MVGPAFFDQPEVRRVIEQLAAADRLTIVVGAGVSMESGLPGWDRLVSGLLKRVGEREGLVGDDLEAFVDWTKSEGPPTAASIARSSLPAAEFTAAICRELYGGRTHFAPGATAEAVTRVRLVFGPGRTRAATTNYDTFLEAAGEDAGAFGVHPGWPSVPGVRSVVDDGPEHDDELVVRHLHGVIHTDGTTEGHIVLAEGDYHLMQHPGQWQEEWFAERVASSTIVFVGMSLTDPNLLRYLYRAEDRGGGHHVAVFSRQDAADLYARHGGDVAAAHEAAVDARWRAVDVHPIRCDYYNQSAQLLFEVAARRRLGDGYRHVRERLAEWEAAVTAGTFTSAQPKFNEQQDVMQRLLQSLVDDVQMLLAADGIELIPDERMQASLWLYRPRLDALVNWCSSDRAWRNPETMAPLKVEWSSPYASIQGFCSGSVAQYSTRDQVATRWNHVVGVPLWIDDDPWGRIPTGVLTLASTGSQQDSILARGLPLLRAEILPELVIDTLVPLFRP